jgi:hypothetical protein
MTDKQLDKLIRRKARAAHQMNVLREQLDPEIEARYGIHPSEIDCDPAIDALDYGLAPDFDLAAFDKVMAEYKHPAKSAND